MKTILIAGGKGLIGNQLKSLFVSKGYEVRILTRNPKSTDEYKWNPKDNTIDLKALSNVNVLINLCGEGIAEKRWTDKRKQELYDSRIGTTNFLYSLKDQLPELETYISASGITCYGFENHSKIYSEEDEFGKDYISQLVKKWEESADQFSSICRVVKLRTAVVLSKNGGALPKLLKPIQLGIGSPLGTGKQIMPWIHINDLANLFLFSLENTSIIGSINCLTDNSTNKEVTIACAHLLNKKLWFPNVPGFIMKLILGELSIILLDGVKVSNSKIKEKGFVFIYYSLEKALKTD
ncbi:MAG: TIGR01777 family oxidoreductase [Fluviicola sp.]|nr:TIGR01777 family oxidoreductase [Fluviicola sp.]